MNQKRTVCFRSIEKKLCCVAENVENLEKDRTVREIKYCLFHCLMAFTLNMFSM